MSLINKLINKLNNLIWWCSWFYTSFGGADGVSETDMGILLSADTKAICTSPGLKGWASTVATGCASASCVYVALEPELVLPTPGQLPNMELQGGREVEG